MNKLIVEVIATFVVALILAAIGILFGFLIMLLWNALMPELFNLKEISFWQAVGLYIFSWLLFKSSSVSKKE